MRLKKLAAVLAAAVLCTMSMPMEGFAIADEVALQWDDDGALYDENGVRYKVQWDGSTASVSGYDGSAPEVVFPKRVSTQGKSYTVQSIGAKAFYKNDQVTSVTLSTSITSIEEKAFGLCSELTEVKCTTILSNIGDFAFYGCEKLEQITIENRFCVIFDSEQTFHPNTVICGYSGSTAAAYAEKYGRTFIALDGDMTDPAETTVFVPAETTTLYVPAETTTAETTVPETTTTTAVMTMPETTTTETTTTETTAETTTTAATETTLPPETTTSATPVELLTWETADDQKSVTITGLKEEVTALVIPAEIGGLPVTAIGSNAFCYKKELTSVILPEGVTAIGDYAFYECSSLKDVTASEHLETVGFDAFANTAWLLSQKAKGGLVILSGILIDGTDCKGELVLPGEVRRINRSAFSGCTELTSVELPDSITSLGDCAFYECPQLAHVKLSGSLTSIGYGTFYNCDALETIEIPARVKSIADYAFADCGKLADIKILAPDCEISTLATVLYNTWDAEAAVYRYTGSVTGYQGSTAERYAESRGFTFVSLGEAQTVVLGDITGEGAVNASDAARLLTAAAQQGTTGELPFTEAQRQAADVNKDGQCNASDAALILMYSAAVGTGFAGTMEDYLAR